MEKLTRYLGLAMVIFAVGFNLWLYRLEPTAAVDPNDNSFQYALVDRTNQIWDFAHKKCTEKFGAWNFVLDAFCQVTYLADHWVPNWAEGYNLPFYYSHVPQILIVGSYKIFHSFSCQLSTVNCQISMFTYYHWVIYLLLSLFPLTVFLSLRIIKLPWLIAGFGALLASHLSTDGLYGLDPPSFLWRGYGLSSQLFGMVWMPMAIAYSWKYFDQSTKFQALSTKQAPNNKHQTFEIWNLEFGISGLWPAALTIILTAMGHLGLGIMAMLSLVPLALARPIMMMLQQESPSHIYEVTMNQLTKLLFLSGTVIFFLSYWIVPIFLADNYHNISFWDPPWKFSSYGAKEVMTRLFNGDLFDWGRGPWMTALVIVGLIGAAWTNFPFALLFLFWLLMYFGRTTWGPLIDLIPGMKEFHLSRFIVGVHAAALLLIPIGIQWVIQFIGSVGQWVNGSKFFRLKVPSFIGLSNYLIIGLLILPPIFKQTIEYSRHNDRLIKQANENYEKVKDDEQSLFATLRDQFTRSSLGEGGAGRVFAGRGGGFGKDFRVAETPYYMNLSTYGIPTTLWLPETWSPNSDVEQYFNEDKVQDYDLFGIRYVAAPPGQKPQPFWKLIKEAKTWKLYTIEKTQDNKQKTEQPVGYFTTGVRPAVVATDKRSYGNVVRLWIQSGAHMKGLYPELTFMKDYPRTTGLPNFKMLDEVTYVTPDGTKHNLFQEPPWYQNTTNTTNQQILPISKSETNDSDMIFKTKVDVPDSCTECIVVLKQSFHPNWRVTIDGEPAQPFTVFPFYLATLVPAGTHEIVFSYEPGRLKVGLLLLEVLVLMYLGGKLVIRFANRHLRPDSEV